MLSSPTTAATDKPRFTVGDCSQRCPVCPNKYTCVPTDGPQRQGDYLFLGESPGWDENKAGIPFKGKTGREVNEGYFPLVGLRRENIRIGNAAGCLPDTPQNKLDMSKSAHRELVLACFNHRIRPEIERNKPSLIIPMGAFASYCIDSSIDLELQHGIPKTTEFGTAFPMYHPAGGIHEPKKMLHIRTDWARLRKFIRGTLEVAYDEFEGREDYGVIEDPGELDEDMADMYESPLACDTESTRERVPFCFTYSTRPGRARLIRATDRRSLDRLQYHLDRWNAPILWHNWLYDFTVTEKMGLRFKRGLITDTMVRCFNLGNTPQGLKALAFRELGMKMMDFDDLVTPYSKARVLRYYRDMKCMDWPKPAPFEYRDKDGEIKIKKPHSLNTKLKTFFTTFSKDQDKDIFEMWTKNWADDHEMIEKRMGESWPGKCITHAAEDNWPAVVRYANRDSDALLRLYPVLRNMESNVRRAPQENWRDIIYAV